MRNNQKKKTEIAIAPSDARRSFTLQPAGWSHRL
jgi:hypothetical protein